jgi:hypothetical protein
VGTEATIRRYVAAAPKPRADLVEPLVARIDNGNAMAAVFAPGPDFRRVVRELWPELPPPFAPLTATLLSDRLRHVAISARLPPQGRGQLVVETADAESRDAVRKTLMALPQALAGERDQRPAQMLRAVLDSLDVRADEGRLAIDLPTDEARLADLRRTAAAVWSAATADARRTQRMRQLRDLTLGLLSFESANKRLPPAATVDGQGRPLLSWRVAILPYLDQAELYRRFRQDEPWDSPHNRELVPLMPDIFADPDPAIRRAVGAGKTTFQVPFGPETMFYNNEGTKYSEVKDGSSQTILMVEVVPERAVEWTRPADWQVDLNNPLDGVRRADRDTFATGWADSHAEVFLNSIDAAWFRAFLTRAGGEVIKR